MYVISLGGSLVVPNAQGSDGVDTQFVSAFRDVIMQKIDEGYRFAIVVGGGRTARSYVTSAVAIDATMTDEDKDWIGIHATRLNAHLLRTVFRAVAHPRINDNPHDFAEFRDCKEPVVIASGWRPGFSTDFDAVVLGHNLGAQTVINLSNIDYIYDKDPHMYEDARKIERMSWATYRALIGTEWKPGMHAPFDPVASRFADEHAMNVAIVNGDDLAHLTAYLEHRPWQGTLISNESDGEA